MPDESNEILEDRCLILVQTGTSDGPKRLMTAIKTLGQDCISEINSNATTNSPHLSGGLNVLIKSHEFTDGANSWVEEYCSVGDDDNIWMASPDEDGINLF